MCKVADGLLNRERSASGSHRVIGLGDRRVEDGHHGVADELVDRPTLCEDDRGGNAVVGVEHLDDFLRGSGFGEGGVVPQIGEEDGDFGDRAAECGLVGISDEDSGDVR
jgi:hypothetical protein